MSRFTNQNLRSIYNTGNRDKLRDTLNAVDGFVGDAASIGVPPVVTSGAIDPLRKVTRLSVTGTTAFTLADGTIPGQRVVARVSVSAITPNGSVTPAHTDGTYTSVNTMSVVGTSVELIWNGTGWALGFVSGTLTIT